MTPDLHPPQRFYGPERARAYRRRSSKRSAAEARLLARILEGLPRGPALDAPCGEGRMGALLGELGFQPVGLDYSPAMLDLAGGGIRARIQALPFRDGAFPLVLCHRFLHHLPPRAQEEALRELARVAGSWLVLSFFHPLGLHALRRRIICTVTRRKSGRFTTPPARLKAVLREEGFRPRRILAQGTFLREFRLALFEREESR